MGKRSNEACGCSPCGGVEGCRVDSMVSVDARGQMVLPKELRERAGIRAGDLLAVVTWEMDGKVCCISLMKADELDELVRQKLGPVMRLAFATRSGGGKK